MPRTPKTDMAPPRAGAKVIGRVCHRNRRSSTAIYACHVCDAGGTTTPAFTICDGCDLPACPTHVVEHAAPSRAHPDGLDRCATCGPLTSTLPLTDPTRTP